MLMKTKIGATQMTTSKPAATVTTKTSNELTITLRTDIARVGRRCRRTARIWYAALILIDCPAGAIQIQPVSLPQLPILRWPALDITGF
ncbi:hypothetical protein Pla8534_62460 [Lignipirellula cremea]|uniref:Uncharacterized protein n=1 Tax=Lignipirellula cremea TaxID=2528010 RepID=A0A518E2Q7_9BACT|nr:hypothetical protein Pla8534_62460 [Lignipirellula cremea]